MNRWHIECVFDPIVTDFVRSVAEQKTGYFEDESFVPDAVSENYIFQYYVVHDAFQNLGSK